MLAFKLCFGHRDANDNEMRLCRDFLGILMGSVVILIFDLKKELDSSA